MLDWVLSVSASSSTSASSVSPSSTYHPCATGGDETRARVWMSLFAGMAPTVVIHRHRPRLRLHAISCVWQLVEHYGPSLAPELQTRLFEEILAPVLLTLVQQSLSAQEEEESAFPTTSSPRPAVEDGVTVYAMLQGMFAACGNDAALVPMACATLRSLVTRLPASVELLRHSPLLNTLVRTTVDLMGGLAAAGDDGGTHVTPALRRGGCTTNRAIHHADETSSAPCLSSVLMSAVHRHMCALTSHDAEADYVRARAEWPELARSSLARAVREGCAADSRRYEGDTRASVQKTVRVILTESLWQWLVGRVWAAAVGHNGETARLLCAGMRDILVGMICYTCVTEDAESLELMWGRVHDTLRGDGGCADVMEWTSTHSARSLSLACDDLSGRDAARVAEGALTPPAVWQLLVPYAFALTDYVYATSPALADACRRTVMCEREALMDILRSAHRRRVRAALATHNESRERCEHRSRVCAALCASRTPADEPHGSSEPASPRTSGAVGANDDARQPRSAHEAASPSPSPSMPYVEDRGWIELARLLCLRGCLATHASVLATTMPSASLIELIRYLPSEVEESAMHETLQSLWCQLYPSTALPSTSTMHLCLDLLQTRV